ncbi:MAG: helix-turn-helix transcriptional regulator [Alphaproteobacteria bacterium]|nr:helix-turn-helix transcriptional regulator [Alphaproteobacteria bacterium]
MPAAWQYESEKQRAEMEEQLTARNCWKKLKLVRDISGLSRKQLAKLVGVSESTIVRLETQKTLPTDEFINRLRALCLIGHAKYSKMTKAEKEHLSDLFGTVGGAVSGVGGAIGAVSASGVAGLSAAGITSGLAALGGGTMLMGIGVVAALPLATGLAGYGLVQGIKHVCEANNLKCVKLDDRFELQVASEPEMRPTAMNSD